MIFLFNICIIHYYMFTKFLYSTTDITFTLINLFLSESSPILWLYFHNSEINEIKKINLISILRLYFHKSEIKKINSPILRLYFHEWNKENKLNFNTTTVFLQEWNQENKLNFNTTLYFHKTEIKKINLISRNGNLNLSKFIYFHLDHNYPSSHLSNKI